MPRSSFRSSIASFCVWPCLMEVLLKSKPFKVSIVSCCATAVIDAQTNSASRIKLLIEKPLIRRYPEPCQPAPCSPDPCSQLPPTARADVSVRASTLSELRLSRKQKDRRARGRQESASLFL